jgi:hypothetical protein
MTKSEWIELIRERLLGVITAQDKRFHRNVIEQYITLYRDQIIYELSSKGLINTDGYCKEFIVSVSSDGIGFYSIIPCKLSSMSETQDAIREISGTGTNLQYVPLSADDTRILSNTDAGDVMTKTCYSLIQNTNGLIVRFYKLLPSVTSVVMRIVASFDSYSDDEQVRIPVEPEKLIEAIIKMAIGTPPSDLKNNNSDIKDGHK